MSTHAPPSAKLRRVLWITLAALPTLVVATLLCWVLIAFLTMRDHLGAWRLTVRDDHGADLGHGQITLVAERWHAHWDASPPYVQFIPDLADDAGTLTLNATGAALVTGFLAPLGGTRHLVKPHLDADGLLCCLDGDHYRSFTYFAARPYVPDGTAFIRFDIDYGRHLPVTGTLSR